MRAEHAGLDVLRAEVGRVVTKGIKVKIDSDRWHDDRYRADLTLERRGSKGGRTRLHGSLVGTLGQRLDLEAAGWQVAPEWAALFDRDFDRDDVRSVSYIQDWELPPAQVDGVVASVVRAVGVFDDRLPEAMAYFIQTEGAAYRAATNLFLGGAAILGLAVLAFLVGGALLLFGIVGGAGVLLAATLNGTLATGADATFSSAQVILIGASVAVGIAAVAVTWPLGRWLARRLGPAGVKRWRRRLPLRDPELLPWFLRVCAGCAGSLLWGLATGSVIS